MNNNNNMVDTLQISGQNFYHSVQKAQCHNAAYPPIPPPLGHKHDSCRVNKKVQGV